MKKLRPLAALLLIFSLTACGPLPVTKGPVKVAVPEGKRPFRPAYGEMMFRYQKELDRFAREDERKGIRTGGIVFTGSSSIKMWRHLEDNMAPIQVLNRGFGGATMPEVNGHFELLIARHQPRIVVLYAGENDISNNIYGVADPLGSLQRYMSMMEESLPYTKTIFVSMKPSPLRWEWWEKISDGNALVKAYCDKTPNLDYLDVTADMIGEDGRPRPEIFLRDSLHMNQNGYDLWTKRIKPLLD